MAESPSAAPAVLDGRLINGRVVTPIDAYRTGFAFHDGVIVDASEESRTWGTVEASGGHVLPGLVTAVNAKPADELAWCRKGVTTVLRTFDLSEYLGSADASARFLDIVPVLRLENATTSAHIEQAMQGGIRVFDAGNRAPAALTEALAGGNVRIAVDTPWLQDWVVAAGNFELVITGITLQSLTKASEAKQAGQGSVLLEVTTDVLAEDDDAVWSALLNGTIDMCSMPEAGSPGALPLLMAAVAERGLPYPRIAELTSQTPARAGRITHRKGSLDAAMDADAAVVDAHTPGVRHRPQQPGHVNLVLRRGEFLFLQGEIHAKPISGIALSVPFERQSQHGGR